MSLTACVTGGTGFLGRRLVRRLLREGRHVRCLVRPTSDVAPLLDFVHDEPGWLEIQRGSLTDDSCLERFLCGGDVIYHCAAALSGSTSTLFLNTVVPTRSLVNASVDIGVGRFVLVSSLGIYGTASLRPGATLDETCPVDPHGERRDPYTFSKIRQEEVAWLAYRERGLPLVVVRPGVIYGPGRSLLTSRVGLKLGGLVIRMGGGQLLPYTHVENCAAAILQAGIVEGMEGQVLNIVDDDLPTGRRILKYMKANGTQVRQVWIPRPLIGPLARFYEAYSNWSEGQLPPVLTRYTASSIWKSLRYSNCKAKHLLSWSPEITWSAGAQA